MSCADIYRICLKNLGAIVITSDTWIKSITLPLQLRISLSIRQTNSCSEPKDDSKKTQESPNGILSTSSAKAFQLSACSSEYLTRSAAQSWWSLEI
jgi:hypothetical protein